MSFKKTKLLCRYKIAELNINNDEIPKVAPENYLWNSLSDDYFQHKFFKNKTQRNAIAKILKRKIQIFQYLDL